MSADERHVFISKGISREAFTATAVQATTLDDKLTYFVHEHKHNPYRAIPCNQECTVIRTGKVENVLHVTQSDDASAILGG